MLSSPRNDYLNDYVHVQGRKKELKRRGANTVYRFQNRQILKTSEAKSGRGDNLFKMKLGCIIERNDSSRLQ